MKKLRKHHEDSYSIIVESIYKLTNSRIPFVFQEKNRARFFAPMFKIFDSTNPDSDNDKDYKARIAIALLDVIQEGCAVAAYIDSDGSFVVHLGITTKSCIEAVKTAKKNLEPCAIDLLTYKLFNTNG